MREIAEEYRLSHWSQIMQDRAASGQSIRGYCREKGIGRHVYHYWQRKLRETAAQQLCAPGERGRAPRALVPTGWATVTPSEEVAPEQKKELTLRIEGVEIEVHPGYDEALLVSVCRTLRGIC